MADDTSARQVGVLCLGVFGTDDTSVLHGVMGVAGCWGGFFQQIQGGPQIAFWEMEVTLMMVSFPKKKGAPCVEAPMRV